MRFAIYVNGMTLTVDEHMLEQLARSVQDATRELNRIRDASANADKRDNMIRELWRDGRRVDAVKLARDSMNLSLYNARQYVETLMG